MKIRKIAGILLFLLALSTIGFIFSNSLRNGEESSSQSNAVVEVVEPVAEEILIATNIEPSADNVTHYVRKAAHFSEFALLGFILFLAAGVYPFFSRTVFLLPFPVCALTAAADETIQLFSDGRSAQISDSILDFAGSVSGIIIASILFFFIRFLIHHKNSALPKKEAQQ